MPRSNCRCDIVCKYGTRVIVAVAAEAGCRLLISEDLQDGFTWAGLTIVNPFAQPVHPLLQAALRSS